MKLAEELYQAGFISYPRTETDLFTPDMDLQVWTGCVGTLCAGIAPPASGPLLIRRPLTCALHLPRFTTKTIQ